MRRFNRGFSTSYSLIFNDYIEDKYSERLEDFKDEDFKHFLKFEFPDASQWYDLAFISFYYEDYESAFLMSVKAFGLGCNKGELKLLRLACLNELDDKEYFYEKFSKGVNVTGPESKFYHSYFENINYLTIALYNDPIRISNAFLKFASQLYYDVSHFEMNKYHAMIDLYKFFYNNGFFAEALVLINEILKHNLNPFNLHRKMHVLIVVDLYKEAYQTYRLIKMTYPDYFDKNPSQEEIYLEIFMDCKFKEWVSKQELD